MLFIHCTFSAELIVNCGDGDKCEAYQENIIPLFMELDEHEIVWKKLKDLAVDKSIQSFEIYSYRESNELKYQVDIQFKKIITEIEIDFEGGDRDEIESLLTFKVEQYFDSQLIENSKKRIIENLNQRGFISPKVIVNDKLEDNNVVIKIIVQSDGQKKIRKIIFNDKKIASLDSVKSRFKFLRNASYDKLKISQKVEAIERSFVQDGYYNTKIAIDEVYSNDNQVDLKVDVAIGERLNFSFTGNKTIATIDLLTFLKNEIASGNISLEKSEIISAIKKLYEERSLYNTAVNIENRDGAYRNKIPLQNYYIDIVEGHKVEIKKLYFKGNQKVQLSELENLFYENAPLLISRGYFDSSYIEKFNEIIKNYYLKRGYLLSTVKSNVSFSDEGAEVFFNITEGQKCIVNEFNISGIDEKISLEIKRKLKNKKGEAFNVLSLEEDIKNVIFEIKEQGYYFATLKNYTPEKILKYYANYTLVEVSLDFKLGKKLIYNDLNIQGLIKTKSKTIRRENFLKNGEILTPSKINKLNNRINSLGIFSSISIKPKIINKFEKSELFKSNLNIYVNEKNRGTGILAPGYRTDLGAKFSFSLLYKNLYGLNHTVSLKTLFNRRFSLGVLDARRNAENRQFIESDLDLSYNWPYFLDFFDLDISTSFQRRRVFSFDADILRLSPVLTKQFTDYFSSSLTYQLEDIRQTDATNEKDDARFRVGSLTPGITFDFRDNPVTPRAGSFFSLSWEFGNPYFGSQRGKDFEINYSKVVSRNRFYYPFSNKTFVLALSVSLGYQKNYADELRLNADGSRILNSDDTFQTRGYIPSIKVFRLDGLDNVRGFSNSEINRLENGSSIFDVRVQNTAYFSNLKFEPRYYLNDSIGLGLFFDAGRVFVNHFKPLSLRTSVGASFKFLTPVGSLDFDYGIKTERNRLSDGGKEGFGRFHLSIGLF